MLMNAMRVKVNYGAVLERTSDVGEHRERQTEERIKLA